MVRRQSKRPPNASRPLAAVEALMLELEGVSPEELERLSREAGLPAGKAPDLSTARGYRLDLSAATRPEQGVGVVHKPIRDEVAAELPSSRVRVIGDAMRGAGLRDGDIAELDLDMEPEDGDVVLADIDGVGRVLRTLRIAGGVWVLKAASPGIAPIPVDDPSQVVVHGVVVLPPDR